MLMVQLLEARVQRSIFIGKAGLVCLVVMFTLAAASPIDAWQGGESAREAEQGDGTNQAVKAQTPAKPSEEGKEPQQTPDPKPAAPSQDDKAATSVNVFTGLGMVASDHYKPLTGHQRWEYYLNQNFASLGAFFGPVANSIVDQIEGQPPEWGGGMGGYGKRLASRLGTNVIQGSIQSAGAALLHHEPRYIRSADPRILPRVGHAFLYTLITYNSDGKKRPALASLGSYYASSILTTYWYPSRYTALGDGVRDGNRQVIFSALINQIQEFWPEIKRYVFRRS